MKTVNTLLLFTMFIYPIHATEIRVRNDSKVDFKNVVVGGKKYGDIKSGASAGYETWGTAYRYSSVSLLTAFKPMESMAVDYVGERPLGDGQFTYVLVIKDGDLYCEEESRVSRLLLQNTKNFGSPPGAVGVVQTDEVQWPVYLCGVIAVVGLVFLFLRRREKSNA